MTAYTALYPDLTLTGLYNVLAKLRAGEPLTPAERTIHERGLVTVLRELHDAIDRAVLDAYGWPDLTGVTGHTPHPSPPPQGGRELCATTACLISPPLRGREFGEGGNACRARWKTATRFCWNDWWR